MSEHIELILAQLAEAQVRTQQQVDSNARAIAALGEKFDTAITQTLHSINEENQLISELRVSQEESNVQMATVSRAIAENNEQIEVLISEGRADRLANTTEHQAFRELFQQLLSQLVTRINQIWDRLNAA